MQKLFLSASSAQAGAAALANALPSLVNLKQLDLHWNSIGDVRLGAAKGNCIEFGL